MYVIILSIAGYGFTPAVLMWGVLKVAGLIINIYFFAIIAMIVISWIAPGNTHPGIQLIHQITEPIMAPSAACCHPWAAWTCHRSSSSWF